MTIAEAPRASRRQRWVAWHPLLFAAYPVLFLWSQNLGEASTGDVLPLVALATLAAAVPFVILAVVFRDARRAALIVTPIVLGVLMYGHVAHLVRPLHVRPVLQLAASSRPRVRASSKP